MTYDQYRAMEKTHVCAECGGELLTIWDGENNCHRLCCGTDHTHNGFQQRLSPQKALQRGQADQVIGPGAQRDLERIAKERARSFDMLPKQDYGDLRAITQGDVEALVEFADSVGLNAYLGHVCLFYGRPYPAIDGYYYLNNKRDRPYRIGTAPLDSVARIAYAIQEGDYAFIARAWLDDKLLPEIGLGIATKDETIEKSKKHPDQWRFPVVRDHPQRMAEKRAEWQLLRKLIPLEVKE